MRNLRLKANVIKIITTAIYKCFSSLVWCMWARPRAQPLWGALFRCSSQVGSGLTQNHWNRINKLSKDKHSSLLETFVNYNSKSVTTLAACFKGQRNYNYYNLRYLVIARIISRQKETSWHCAIKHFTLVIHACKTVRVRVLVRVLVKVLVRVLGRVLVRVLLRV